VPDNDSTGVLLDGRHNYEITFAPGQEPPVNGFWSLTLYNEQHLFYQNELNRFSLGTKTKNLKRNTNGSLNLYTSTESPGAGKEKRLTPIAGHGELHPNNQ
jgi:hypothetical protein